jgi:Predicted membrane protein (DUF2306)
MARSSVRNPDWHTVSRSANAAPDAAVATGVERFPLWMHIGFWACLVIAVAVVLRRAFALGAAPSPGVPPQLAALDTFFSSHAALTGIHIGCALICVLLLPFVFWKRTAESSTLQRAFFAIGFLVGATAYAMSVHAVGGWLERSAVLVFNTLFVASLARALVLSRQRRYVEKRRWILRAVSVLLGIATTRPVMGVFFATARATHLTPQQFFGIAFWVGFSINTVAIELWLRRRTPVPARIA